MSVAAIVLAAGFSRRLGRPKQTVEIAGETLVGRAVRVANEAGLRPVLAVVNETATSEAFGVESCTFVQNVSADEGIASSIRAGVRCAMQNPGVHGFLLMPCDQITTTPGHLRALCAHPDRVTGSAYAGKIGIPAYFPVEMAQSLLALTGDKGARDLLQDAHAIEAESLAIDVDTEEDLVRARNLVAEQHGAVARS